METVDNLYIANYHILVHTHTLSLAHMMSQYWDTGRGFTMKYVNGAGFTVLLISIIASLGLAFYTPTS